MRYFVRLVASVAAALLSCAPVAAQTSVKDSALPLASGIDGTERMRSVKGSGCPTSVSPCANVLITPAMLATYLGSSGVFQPADSDLTAIAALSTTAFGRSLLTIADAPTARSALGLGSLATQSGTFSLAYLNGQPLSSNLNALSGVTTYADACLYFSASAVAGTFNCTPFFRGLAASTGALTLTGETIAQPSSGDAVLNLQATVAGTAFDRIEFQRAGGTVNAAIQHGSQISGDYGYLDFFTRGASGYGCRSRLDQAGYFGVGTCTPQAQLDVNGNTIIRGSYTQTFAQANLVASSIYNNTSVSGSTPNGQTLLDFQFNGTMKSRLRTDAPGNINYIVTTGAHYFYTGGDAGTGTLTAAVTPGTLTVNVSSGASFLRFQTNSANTGYVASDTGSLYLNTPSTVQFQVNGTSVASINSAGGLTASDVTYTGSAWTAFTPAVSCASGSLSSSSAAGRYKQIGKTIVYSFYINIGSSGNGTCAGAVYATAPLTAITGMNSVGPGRENAITGRMLQGYIGSGLNYLAITNYDNTYPGGNGYSLNMSITYEVP